jgi:hypothetical protein
LVVPAIAPVAAAARQPAATPARQGQQQAPEVAKLAVTQVDLVSETEQRFFTADQFGALEKLAGLLMPPLKGKPGALDAHAPEFLDFLIGVSPVDRQSLYRHGLDGLNTQAHQRFHKPFQELQPAEADTLVRPLLVARYWPQEPPSDPMQHFMAQVHEDLREATTNSREWAGSGGASSTGRPVRQFNRGRGLYWNPIDPVVRS